MSNRGLSVVEAAVIIVVVVTVALVIAPVFMHSGGHWDGPNCQSNMQQIGKAIKTYMTDWDDTYPTNRRWVSPSKLGPVTDQVKLSPAGTDKEGNPIRFRHGLNWVEGVYAYIEATSGPSDSASVWRCPAASEAAYPAGSETALVTYAFNRNLIEKSERVVRTSGDLLMVREMDRCVESVLRPINDSNGKASAPPVSPFLNKRDVKLGWTNPSLHADRSNVLFADGHVRLCELDYFPPQRHYTRKNCWDAETGQWYNFAQGANALPRYTKSIAITP